MSTTVYIGDEVCAAGYRLCGVDVYIAEKKNAAALIEQACETASLVLIGSSVAKLLDEGRRDELMSHITPPVLVVPDLAGDSVDTLPDISSLIHKQLGMLE